MIVIYYLSVLSKHESDQRLHGLSGVGIVQGGLWAFTLLEPFFLVAILLLLIVLLLLLRLLLLLLLWSLHYI